MKMKARSVVLVLLAVTVIAPIVLYTDNLISQSQSLLEDNNTNSQFAIAGDTGRLNVLPQETSTHLKEPVGVVFSDDSNTSLLQDHKSSRVLSATNEEDPSRSENIIKQITDDEDAGNSQNSRLEDAVDEGDDLSSVQQASDSKDQILTNQPKLIRKRPVWKLNRCATQRDRFVFQTRILKNSDKIGLWIKPEVNRRYQFLLQQMLFGLDFEKSGRTNTKSSNKISDI